MATVRNSDATGRLQILSEFRHQLRMFLQFSEEAAAEFDLQPQQHQLLLHIAGTPDGVDATIGYAASRLGVRHNAAVGLSKRCEHAGLLTRRHTEPDKRKVILDLTAKGRKILEALSENHARELYELEPQLIKNLLIVSSSVRRGIRPRSKKEVNDKLSLR